MREWVQQVKIQHWFKGQPQHTGGGAPLKLGVGSEGGAEVGTGGAGTGGHGQLYIPGWALSLH